MRGETVPSHTTNRQLDLREIQKPDCSQTRAANSRTETHLGDLAVRGRRISVGRPTGAFKELEKTSQESMERALTGLQGLTADTDKFHSFSEEKASELQEE